MKWNWHGIHSDLVESIGVIYLEIIIDSNNNIIHAGHWHGFSKIYCPFYFATISARKCLFVQNEQKITMFSFFIALILVSWTIQWCTICICRMNKSKNKSKLNCMCLNLVNTRFMAFKVIFWLKRSTTTKSGDSITYLAPSLILLAAQDKRQRDTFKDQNAIDCMC